MRCVADTFNRSFIFQHACLLCSQPPESLRPPFDLVLATDILYSSQHDEFQSLLSTLVWACGGESQSGQTTESTTSEGGGGNTKTARKGDVGEEGGTEIIIVESVSFSKQ